MTMEVYFAIAELYLKRMDIEVIFVRKSQDRASEAALMSRYLSTFTCVIYNDRYECKTVRN